MQCACDAYCRGRCLTKPHGIVSLLMLIAASAAYRVQGACQATEFDVQMLLDQHCHKAEVGQEAALTFVMAVTLRADGCDRAPVELPTGPQHTADSLQPPQEAWTPPCAHSFRAHSAPSTSHRHSGLSSRATGAVSTGVFGACSEAPPRSRGTCLQGVSAADTMARRSTPARPLVGLVLVVSACVSAQAGLLAPLHLVLDLKTLERGESLGPGPCQPPGSCPQATLAASGLRIHRRPGAAVALIAAAQHDHSAPAPSPGGRAATPVPTLSPGFPLALADLLPPNLPRPAPRRFRPHLQPWQQCDARRWPRRSGRQTGRAPASRMAPSRCAGIPRSAAPSARPPARSTRCPGRLT